jgi:hypothetical protein
MEMDTLKRKLFVTSEHRACAADQACGLTTEEILADFEAWRKIRPNARRKT